MAKQNRHSTAGTVAYGLFVIVPIAVVFLLLVKLTEILEKIAAPMGLESALGAAIVLILAIVIAILLVLLLSWLIGALMRRLLSYEKFETAILNQVPGYQIVANIVRGFAEGETSYPAALIEIHGAGVAALGFVMEEHDNGKLTVYVPSVPVLTVGNVFLVDRDRVTLLDAGPSDIADCVSQWGMGFGKMASAPPPQSDGRS